MSNGSDQEATPKKRKRQPHPAAVIRDLKAAGEAHQTHKTNVINLAKKIGPPCNCSRLQCFVVIKEEVREAIFHSFYENCRTKNDQDAHLTGLISMKPIERRRPRVACGSIDQNGEVTIDSKGKNPNLRMFVYKVRHDGVEYEVCYEAFLSIHGISRPQVRNIQNGIITKGCAPRDGRGLHGNYHTQTPEPLVKLIESHINRLAKRQSHYSLRENPEKYYLHESLNSIAQLHRLFLDEYQIAVTYDVYRSIFNQFKLGFSLPRSDTCPTCDAYRHNVAQESDADKKMALQVEQEKHLNDANMFRTLKNKYREHSKENKLSVLSFDYMQNLPLPNIETSDVFYSRQIWTHTFGVHNLKTSAATLYVYDEMNGGKGANNVVSLLYTYLTDATRLPSNLPLMLLCDSCPGQNKNYTMVRFLYFLVHVLQLVPKITLVYPIRGHSYLPNDQDFSVISKNKKRIPAETPSDWMRWMNQAKVNDPKFVVNGITYDKFIDFEAALKPYFLTTTKPLMKIKSARMIQINRADQEIKIRYSFEGPWNSIQVRKKNIKFPDIAKLVFHQLYSTEIPLKDKKIKDIRKLMKYIRNKNSAEYYDRFRSDITTRDEDEYFEVFEVDLDDDDDNSSGVDD